MRRFTFLFVIAALVLFVGSCGGKDEDEEDCPSFSDFQIYPMTGGPDTPFELLVVLRNDSENADVERIRADLLTSDGTALGQAFDLVRSDADAKRYLRAFLGEEVCDEDICNVFFRVIAEHQSGCLKGFDTPVIHIESPGAADDDTADDDTADDDAADDDTTDDDTADDDADDDTGDDDTG